MSTMSTTVGKLARIAGVALLLIAFVQIVMAFFPVRADEPALSQDAKSGRTHEVIYFEANDAITLQWRAGLRLKSFTQDITSVPKDPYVASFVQRLRIDAASPDGRVVVRQHDPSADWGGVAALFAPVYISLVSPWHSKSS